ncbi:hypothetical protein PHYBOEH_002629 [Phytophthora boehmeriae]|uniref:SGNH hydrolase-type esterase domain-containing protein n=1 Tax=Phytophthora boehmeriae TaxID=109152 RepID=A0A8T1WVC2_9STRA|nr:hypothetical protein PHYBOEH_002629 [Phytophthora boehmeriae]
MAQLLTWRILSLGVALIAIFAAYFVSWEGDIRTFVDGPSQTRPALLLLGDSLTEIGVDPDKAGWAALLQNHFRRSADVLPRGLSGYNTKWFIEFALPVITRELSSGDTHPALITLWLGANDAALVDGPSRRQHVPVDVYTSNLIVIIRSLRASAPRAAVLLITPPHVDDEVRLSRSRARRLDRSNSMAGEYARACMEVAKTVDVPVLDLHSWFNALPPRERSVSLEDGLHLSTLGNRWMERLLRAKMAESFPDLMVRLHAQDIPDWSQLP